jgi:hypothetical protein
MTLRQFELCLDIYQSRWQGARIRDKNINVLRKKCLSDHSYDSGVKNDPCQKVRHTKSPLQVSANILLLIIDVKVNCVKYHASNICELWNYTIRECNMELTFSARLKNNHT